MSTSNFTNIQYEEDNFYTRDTTNYLVRSTQVSPTNLWTGIAPKGITEYEDGLTINYFLSQSGTNANATLNLTVDNVELGAKPIFLGNSMQAVTNQFPQYSIIRLTYIIDNNLNSGNGCWKVSAYHDTSSSGTVTNITPGVGLTTLDGNSITTSGTIKTKLNSETSIGTIGTTNKLYAVGVDTNGKLAVQVPWTNENSAYINPTLTLDGIVGYTSNHYATCTTSASSEIKDVVFSSSNGTITSLTVGLRLIVNFGTIVNTADNPSLRINGGTSKEIYHNGQPLTSNKNSLITGTVEFIYDGSHWNLVGFYQGGGVSELTQSQYDGLTPAQKSDGTIYFINDGMPEPITVNNLQNLVDGSATGSVRGIGTIAEDSSYVMGTYAFAEGYDTKASGDFSHAEGINTVATDEADHAEGYDTIASGQFSHAEGVGTIASGYYAHVEGQGSQSTNEGSHAEGFNTVASGKYSHSQNSCTIAQRKSQTALGEYNIADTDGYDSTTRGSYVVIVGNGNDDARSNALTVDWSGNVITAGTVSQSSDKNLKEHKAYISEEAIDFINSLKPASFIKDSENHIGFYAQDVEKIDPWNCLVNEMGGYKTLNYIEIIAPLVAYCQKLEERVRQLEKE